MSLANIFESIPDTIDKEVFELILQSGDLKIERIISKGHSSPGSGWHQQQLSEWVIVLRGSAVLGFEDKAEVHLDAGSYYNISANVRHRVVSTSDASETVWLAVHY